MKKSTKPEMKWEIIKEVKREGLKKIYLLCRCSCGIEKEVRKSSYGRDSFGCKKCRDGKITHGMSNSSIYTRWMAMKQRCCNPNQYAAKNYLYRGISVCKEWENSFDSFYKWSIKNGFQENLSLDRIDNDKGYFPDNCRWTTRDVQNRNQRSNIRHSQDGKEMILKDWCKYLDFNYDIVRSRIYSGQTVKEALSYKTKTVFKDKKKINKLKSKVYRP